MNHRVESYFLTLNQELLLSVFSIRELIMTSAPAMEECIKYKVPFYSFNGPLFYFNKKGKGVNLGFYHGVKLKDETSVLSGHELKMIRHFYFDETTEIPLEIVKDLILQSIDINLQKSKRTNTLGK